MFISPDYADKIGKWDIGEMKRLNDSLGDGEYLMRTYESSDPGQSLFRSVVPYMLDEFIDYEKRDCDFTGLADLLEFCREAKVMTESVEGAAPVALYDNYFSNIGNYIFYRKNIPADAVDIGYPRKDGGNGSYVIPGDSMSITKFCPAPDAAWRFCRSMIGFQKKLCTYDETMKFYMPMNGVPCTLENLDLLIDNYLHYHHIVEYLVQTDINGVEHSGYYPKYINKDSRVVLDGTPLTPSDEDFAAAKAMINNAGRIQPDDPTSLSIILEEASAYFSGIRSAEETVKLISDRVGTRIEE